MEKKNRILLKVYVDLDPVPGAFHTKESARAIIGQILAERIPHYNPRVSVTPNRQR